MDQWSTIADMVEAARQGDATAWARLVDEFAPMVLAVARRHRLSQADVDDVFQVVWIRLVENLDKIREPARLAGWLSTTTRREALRVAARPTVTEFTDLVGDDSAEEAVMHDLDHAEVLTALKRLDQRCRDLLDAIIVRELSYDAISTQMQMPVGSIGPTRQRCLERLRQSMVTA
ncbi:MAG: sigma-70 family RNA polymerase sigma factor [Actinomycetia bacterium]|nr:sigma-70 family RNA polymerase sigma factor [Actinomycetes bacterium]